MSRLSSTACTNNSKQSRYIVSTIALRLRRSYLRRSRTAVTKTATLFIGRHPAIIKSLSSLIWLSCLIIRLSSTQENAMLSLSSRCRVACESNTLFLQILLSYKRPLGIRSAHLSSRLILSRISRSSSTLSSARSRSPLSSTRNTCSQSMRSKRNSPL